MTRQRVGQLLVIFRACRWLGAFPLDASYQRGSAACLTTSLAIATAFICYTLYQLSSNLTAHFSSISSHLLLTILGLFPLLHTYHIYTARHRFSWSIQVLAECDKALEELGLSLRYDWPVLLGMFMTRLVFSVAHNLLTAGVLAAPTLVFFGVGYFIVQLVEMQFFTLLLILRTMFAGLTSAIHPSSKKRHLEALAKCHHLLAAVGDNVESIYSIQVLGSLSFIYVALLNSSLDAIKAFLKLLKGIKAKAYVGEVAFGLGLNVSWLIYCLAHFQTFAYYCVLLSKEVKKTNKVLYRTILRSNRKQLMNSGKLKLQLEMYRDVKITACGMFPLDYTMVHSVAASAAVFLVIISQFDT